MQTSEFSKSDMRVLTARQRAIYDHIARQGFATLDALAMLFSVSVQTVRREIIHLDRCGLVERFHGGAGAIDKTRRRDYSEKKAVAREGKQRIASKIITDMRKNETVFLDVGTTLETVAQLLAARAVALRVVTASLPAAMALAGADQVETHVIGGIVGGADGSLVGAFTAESLSQYTFDRCIISASGYDSGWAPTDFDLQKIFLKRLAIKRSDLAILAMDRGKFDRRAPITVARLPAFARLVTDGQPPDGLLEAARGANVGLDICEM
ncbi:MAG: DeoR/GlpR family DNA-binding transcription regulator [Salinarimonas sp.]